VAFSSTRRAVVADDAANRQGPGAMESHAVTVAATVDQ